jgi:hypothetical protein
MTAHLPIPDVAGGAHTHLGAALIHFGSCYVLLVWACKGLEHHLQAQTPHNIGSRMCLDSFHPSFLFFFLFFFSPR